jgi:hypothetical protein
MNTPQCLRGLLQVTAFAMRKVLQVTAFAMRGLLQVTALITFVALICKPADAQWKNVPSAVIPHGADGKPNLAAPTPRLPDGHPDLAGVWEATGGYNQNIAKDLKPDEVPYQPWAKALAAERATGSHEREDPDANCLPQGVPRISAVPPPWRIIQTPGYVAIIYEAFNLWRQIFLDGRELGEDFIPSWIGYSTGKWDGDTLVVDTRGFNGKTWLDQSGKPATDALHVIERFRRRDFGHMEIQITIDDPKAYTKPWTVTEQARLRTDTELLEYICNENNVDLQHLNSKPADRGQ